MKFLTKSVIFLLMGAFLFIVIQGFLVPKNLDKLGYVVNGYWALEENSIDVLFLGTSKVLYGVSPMRIYEDTSLKTYSLGTTGQPFDLSYTLLKIAFRTQKPKIVVLDVSGLFQPNDMDEISTGEKADSEKSAQVNYGVPHNMNYNAYWRWIIDYTPLGMNKLTLAKDYLKMPYSDDALTLIFPLLNYHSRWVALEKSDFSFNHLKGLFYSAGENFYVDTVPAPISAELMNGITDVLVESNVGKTTMYDGEKIQTRMLTEPVYEPVITERHLECLNKMKTLCDENGAELILIMIPSVDFPPKYSASTKIKSDMVRELSQNLDIDYIDFLYDYDELIDFSTDTCDGGGHLNPRGAEKISVALEPILTMRIPNGERSDPVYEKMLTQYQKIRDIIYLEMETDFYVYIDGLEEKRGQYAIFIAASDDYTQGMSPQDYSFLKEKLGLRLIQNGVLADSYIAVIDCGELIYEELSDRRITHEMDFLNSGIKLVSSGTFHNQLASVEIDGMEYALSRPGLNIVVYDYETDLIVDIAAINTQSAEKPVTHGQMTSYFLKYEAAIRAAND